MSVVRVQKTGLTVRTGSRHGRYHIMTRYVFKAIDLGASVIFMALCAKAFCVHFFRDIEGRLQRRKLPLIQISPSLVPANTVAFRRPPSQSVRSASHHQCPPESY
jgi:hypothetical protein